METILSKIRKDHKESLRQRALRMLETAVTALFEEGATKVYAFGSVLRPGEFNEHSDVDIAAEGIAPDKRYFVEIKLEGIFEDIHFDLIYLEDAIRPEIRERILKEGMSWKR